MIRYALSHLPDAALRRDLAGLVARDRATTAELLAHLAEFDARRLYLPAAYPSMYAYCVGELGFSEDAACNRIRVARTARRFPAIFEMLADGRLHLSAVVTLAPFLSPENNRDLLAASTHLRKAEVERLLAERFPRPDLPERFVALPCKRGAQATESAAQAATLRLSVPGRIENSALSGAGTLNAGPAGSPGPAGDAPLGAQQGAPTTETPFEPQATAPAEPQSPATTSPSVPGRTERPRLAPLSPARYALQVTVGQATHDRLRHAQALLRHQVPSGDVAEVLDRALVALIEKLERQKLAATDRPRAARPSRDPRHVPAHVRRAVWKRDQGRCTFTSDSGRRCEARDFLEFDHVEPVARGGRATISGIRLRCRSHNPYAAERAFGAGFMSRKREAVRESRGAMACADSALDRSGQGNDRICPAHDRVGHARGDPARGASGRATYPGSRSPTPGPMGQPST